MYGLAIIAGGLIPVLLLSFLFKKIFRFLENERLQLAISVGLATIASVFISGFGFADGGTWNPSWLYLVSGAMVWVILFLRGKPKQETSNKQEPQLLNDNTSFSEPSELTAVSDENADTIEPLISPNTISPLRTFLFRLSRLLSIVLFLGMLLALLVGMVSGELLLAVVLPLAFASIGVPIVLIFNWLACGKISLWLN